MSPSARRLAAHVATERFDWQLQMGSSTNVVPLLRRGPEMVATTTVASAMRDLPSPSAERVEAIEREAFGKGYAEGERAGEAAAKARIDAMLQRLTDTIRDIAALRAGVMRRSEREIVRLALAMAERVVRREIDIDRDLLAVMARVAIDRLGENAIAKIHLHPTDYEAARPAEAQPGSVEIVADINVPRGGCLVRSAFGSIDAGIDAQMRELARALLGDDTEHEEPAHGLPADL